MQQIFRSRFSAARRAFSLIELLVVIAIIAILAGVLLGNYSGIVERVRSAKCQSNLKNLANAVNSCAAGGSYPYAESAQYVRSVGNADDQGLEIREHKGWISWLSRGVQFPLRNAATISHCSYANSDPDAVSYAITNGAIWTAMGKNRSSYVCPVHVDRCRRQGVTSPGWSYKMNAYFGYEAVPGEAMALSTSVIWAGSLTRADRMLLFAEIPALTSADMAQGKLRKIKVSLPEANLTGGDGDAAMCGCLKTKGVAGDAAASGSAASIGFNHVRGKDMVGHVAFADGHVETLAAPRDGNFTDLTDWLCQALDVVYHNRSYQKIDNSATE